MPFRHPISKSPHLSARRLLFLPLMFILIGLTLQGCAPAQWLGVRLIFDETPISEDRVLRNVAYVDEDRHPQKHQLDLFLPEGRNWPTLIFVHGGGWTEGDKNLQAGGIEIYGNIGAYYTSKGIGVGVINYRLQPDATWRQQTLDVAYAVRKVRELVREHGGDADALFLSGHSAGAQLAALVAVADWPGQTVEVRDSLCGVVAISGAGYALDDAETYSLGADIEYYQARFPAENGDDQAWPEDASVVRHLDAADPPFLVYYAGDEYPSLQHQARLLHERLQEAEVHTELAVVPGQGHRRIILTFSQEKHEMTSKVRKFIEERHQSCREARS